MFGETDPPPEWGIYVCQNHGGPCFSQARGRIPYCLEEREWRRERLAERSTRSRRGSEPSPIGALRSVQRTMQAAGALMKPSPRTGRRRSHFGEVTEDDTHRATRDLHMPESMMKEEALRGSLPVPNQQRTAIGTPTGPIRTPLPPVQSEQNSMTGQRKRTDRSGLQASSRESVSLPFSAALKAPPPR